MGFFYDEDNKTYLTFKDWYISHLHLIKTLIWTTAVLVGLYFIIFL
jgi:hypothetical protein